MANPQSNPTPAPTATSKPTLGNGGPLAPGHKASPTSTVVAPAPTAPVVAPVGAYEPQAKGRARWAHPKDHVDANGKLTTANVWPLGYHRDTYQWLRSTDFANPVLWLEFRAADLRHHAAAMVAQAAKMDAQRAALAQFGSPVAARAAAKAQRTAQQLAKLRAELVAQGVDVTTLGL